MYVATEMDKLSIERGSHIEIFIVLEIWVFKTSPSTLCSPIKDVRDHTAIRDLRICTYNREE